MLLALSTWPEIESWLRRSKTVVIPIGSNEQHGPTGLLGTDWLCPEIIAHEAHRRGGDILVAPTFNIGMAQHHLGFPGTISLRPSTFQAAICDWVESLSRHGFERIYLFNGHGGNIASIEAAFSEAYAKYSFAAAACPFMLKLRSWWQLPRVGALAEELFPSGHGSHATPSEIAITQSAYPASIKNALCAPPIAPTGPIRDALDYRARFPDGRIGSNPSLASPEKGARLIAASAAALLEEIAEFTREPFPGLGSTTVRP
ncbi:MAG: creatininase family protein [Pseudomonadota bacterium]|nr:creatininase family protein [Pseudomonadota bacterium]